MLVATTANVETLGTRFINFSALGFEADVLEVENGLITAHQPSSAALETVDLAGATVIPAFRDGHAHPLFAGREAMGVQISACTSIEQIVAGVAEFASTNTAEWLIGGAYDRSLHPSPRAEWLDAVVSDRPMVLHASDHHTIWVNTEALKRAGIQDGAPEVTNGSIDVDLNGRPTGVLREPGAMSLVLDKIPKPTIDQELAALAWAQQRLLELGIVEVQDAWVTRAEAETYLAAAESEMLEIDFNLAFRIEATSWHSDIEYHEALRAKFDRISNARIRVNAAKFFADGVFGSGTAMVSEPYLDRPHHGEPVWNRDELFEATKLYSRRGYQLHIHAIGDAAIELALDAIEQSGATESQLPSVIAHAELIADKDLTRFRELNVIANMQPLWAREDGMLLSCEPALGRSRIDKMYRMRDLANSGAAIAFGSDWPVSSPDPLLGIATAVTRSQPGGKPWTTAQSLSFSEALACYTSGVCMQLGRPIPLSIGAAADFLILGQQVSLQQPFDLKLDTVYLRGQRTV